MRRTVSLNPLSVFGETLDDLNLDLEKFRRHELEGLLIRTHCTWIEEGEKPTVDIFVGWKRDNMLIRT